MDKYILLFQKLLDFIKIFEVHLLEVLLQVECFFIDTIFLLYVWNLTVFLTFCSLKTFENHGNIFYTQQSNSDL